MGNSLIIAQNISKTFVAKGLFSAKKENHVLHHVDLEIYNNETLALVGESGCGNNIGTNYSRIRKADRWKYTF